MDSEIPVVYTAVTDPVAAKLAKDDGTAVGNVTGTSDELPIKAQLEMIREMMPDAKKIGILYTTSEANSVSALAKYDDLAGDYGFEIVEKGISQTADISLAAEGLDYVALGKQTGKMAAKILKGEKKASDMQFETITEPGFYVNNEVAKNLGITVPEDLQDKAVESFDEITK